MQEMHGTVMHYAWGTTDRIPAILGVPADGRPCAEYWLGAHTRSPSTVAGRRLDETLRDHPHLLGDACVGAFGDRLPFLMKILSARRPLSIQAHPSREKAEEGYAREDAAEIPVDDPARTYRDDWPKPEMIIALDSGFHSLVGFRDAHQTINLFQGLGVLDIVQPVTGPLLFRRGSAGLEEVFLDVLSLTGDRLDIINHILAAAVRHAGDPGPLGDFARTVLELDEAFPGDAGIMAALLMNRVRLAAGEALNVPTGTMHAHLSGTGIEVMANSDNVIRGGLTTKHIAVDDLVSVVDFAEITPVILRGTEVQPGVFDYPSECPEFDVWRLELEPDRRVDLPAHGTVRVALVTRGTVRFSDGVDNLTLSHGQAAFLPATNAPAAVMGEGEVFLTSPGIA